MKIVFATGNIHKLREVQEILGPDYELVMPKDLGITEDIPETGETLAENSLQKANYVHDRTGLDCFADDTGLEVDALDGAPGVYTARYAALAALAQGDEELAARSHDFDSNMDLLLKNLNNCENRRACFKSVITLIKDGQTHQFEGCMEGNIARSKAGCGGFGYDPVFIADAHPGVTVAEISEDEKNAISHRGMAIRAMVDWLKANR